MAHGMKGATVFSGIGAPEVAMPWVEWLWHAEVEAFPSAVMAAQHPRSVNLGDVTAADFLDRAIGYGPLDLLVGGSPCQAFSVAGQRRSLADDRGNLTLRFVEIVHAIRPLVTIWENVPGVLSTTDNAFGCFLGGLVGADDPIEVEKWPSAGVVCGPLGRGAWRVLDAQYFGLAQRRKRVFLVFCFGDGADPREILFEKPRVLGNPPARGAERETVAGSLASRASAGGGLGTDFELGGGLSRALKGKSNMSHREDSDTLVVAHALRADGFDASEDGTGRGTPLVVAAFGGGNGAELEVATTMSSHRSHRDDFESDTMVVQEIVPPLRAGGNSSGGPRPVGTDVDTCESLVVSVCLGSDPIFAEDLAMPQTRRNGDPGVIAFDTTQVTSKANCSQPRPGSSCHPLAAGAHPPVIAFNLRGRDGGSMPEATDVASLRASSGGSSRTYVGVRRLTPRECERLQGFPDDYTLVRYRGKPAADGPRYKALGNSMAVPVLRWIGERIAASAPPPADSTGGAR